MNERQFRDWVKVILTEGIQKDRRYWLAKDGRYVCFSFLQRRTGEVLRDRSYNDKNHHDFSFFETYQTVDDVVRKTAKAIIKKLKEGYTFSMNFDDGDGWKTSAWEYFAQVSDINGEWRYGQANWRFMHELGRMEALTEWDRWVEQHAEVADEDKSAKLREIGERYETEYRLMFGAVFSRDFIIR